MTNGKQRMEVRLTTQVTRAQAAKMARERGLPADTKISIDNRLAGGCTITFEWTE